MPPGSPLYLAPDEAVRAALQADYGLESGAVLAPGVRCPACVGLLQDAPGLIPVDELAQACRPYSAPTSYCLALSVPPLCLFRDACLRARAGDDDDTAALVPVKDVLRAVLVPVIGRVLPDAQPATRSPFRIEVDLNWAEADLELGRSLAPFVPRTLPRNVDVKQLRRTSLTSAKFVDKAVSVMTRAELGDVLLQAVPGGTAPARVGVVRDPVFLTGSYAKFCRRLSQTPWLVGGDGGARMDGSVQDLIAAPILERFGAARTFKFHSAGREDVDVRMLGGGRQFIVEIGDPHRVPALDMVQQLQDDINRSTDRVQVHSLALTDDAAAQFKMLDDGARSKTKSYRAVIWTSAPLTDAVCGAVSTTDPFEIEQLTPIRVLHRRALLARRRTIYRLVLAPINAHFAVLDLETQAGTYIKELVHGDRGRTQPNLGSMMSCQADILQLDVLDLHHQ